MCTRFTGQLNLIPAGIQLQCDLLIKLLAEGKKEPIRPRTAAQQPARCPPSAPLRNSDINVTWKHNIDPEEYVIGNIKEDINNNFTMPQMM